jgi:hypothetical protein
LQNQADTADQTLRNSLLNQQQILKEVAPQALTPDTTGWLLLGQVDEEKQKWFGEGAKNAPSTLDPVIREGTRFTLPRTTYLYGDAATDHHFEGPILSALPAGTQVEVLAGPDYSDAIRGGYFIGRRSSVSDSVSILQNQLMLSFVRREQCVFVTPIKHL